MSIEDVLRGAEVLTSEYTDYDLDAAERRLAHRIAERQRNDSSMWMLQTAAPTPWGTDTRLTGARASGDLRAMSLVVLKDRRVRCRLNKFARGPHHDTVGATAFGCLLHLLGRTEPARFWWNYAAGAGNMTAAYCLYLDHLSVAEYILARHWHDVVWVSGFMPDKEWGSRLAARSEVTDLDPDVINHITEIRDPEHGDINLPASDLPFEFARCP